MRRTPPGAERLTDPSVRVTAKVATVSKMAIVFSGSPLFVETGSQVIEFPRQTWELKENDLERNRPRDNGDNGSVKLKQTPSVTPLVSLGAWQTMWATAHASDGFYTFCETAISALSTSDLESTDECVVAKVWVLLLGAPMVDGFHCRHTYDVRQVPKPFTNVLEGRPRIYVGYMLDLNHALLGG